MSVWRNLGERTVCENRWCTVNMADVELPDGRHLDHTVMPAAPGRRGHSRQRRERGAAPVAAPVHHRRMGDMNSRPAGPRRARIRSHAAARELEEDGMAARADAAAPGRRPHARYLDLAPPRVLVGHGAAGPRDPRGSSRDVAPGLGSADKIPDLITRGEIRSANAVAALLMLHQLRVAARP